MKTQITKIEHLTIENSLISENYEDYVAHIDILLWFFEVQIVIFVTYITSISTLSSSEASSCLKKKNEIDMSSMFK